MTIRSVVSASRKASVALFALTSAAAFLCTQLWRERQGDAAPTFRLASASFSDGQEIPSLHTCEGKDVSPPLEWFDAPRHTKSFAIVLDDPDAPDPRAPKTTWVHWVEYNLPGEVSALSQGAAAHMPAGSLPGLNDWHAAGYRGPCPPTGRHRYFHKLYALDTVLTNLGQPTKADLERAMKGHVLGQATLLGTYAKN
jgi:Raf kinase inhibitor-like YbhB/YbcL family protein